MTAARRLLLLVLDAANPALLTSWAADGSLPNLARLMAEGITADTRSVEGLLDGSTWPSFYTAMDPAGHGFYWLEQLRPGTYRTQSTRARDVVPQQPFWELLSDAGRRVMVLDAPLTRRAPRLNGVQVAEWGPHDVTMGFATVPAGLKRTILKRFGPHPAPEPCDADYRSAVDYRAFAQRLAQGAATRARMARELLADPRWDFAIEVFSECHCAGHQMWHLHDASHPAFPGTDSQPAENLLRTVYQTADAAVGDVLATVSPDTTVVVLTLHSMSYSRGASFLLPEILERLGVVRPAAEHWREGPRLDRGWAERALRAGYHLLPKAVRHPLHRLRQEVNQRWLERGSLLPINPRQSRCFAVTIGPACGGIRLNLRGREPLGTLAPGSEAESFCDQLTRDLLELRVAQTGRPLVRQVLRSGDLFRGPYLETLPDLLVEWDPEHRLGSTTVGSGAGALLQLVSPRLAGGPLEASNRNCRTGEHRLEGMLVARGPGIGQGRTHQVISDLDLAPTFTRFLGCAMEGVAGRPVPHLLEP